MSIEITARQQKTVEKIKRLRKYYDEDRPEIYEWSPSDEALDFASMSDEEVTDYLKKN
jgi:hypothetical protein